MIKPASKMWQAIILPPIIGPQFELIMITRCTFNILFQPPLPLLLLLIFRCFSSRRISVSSHSTPSSSIFHSHTETHMCVGVCGLMFSYSTLTTSPTFSRLHLPLPLPPPFPCHIILLSQHLCSIRFLFVSVLHSSGKQVT